MAEPVARDFLEEIRYLRFERGFTLSSIGHKIGVGRERIRQLLGNTGDYRVVRLLQDADDLKRKLWLEESITLKDVLGQYNLKEGTVYKHLGSRVRYFRRLGVWRCPRCKKVKALSEFQSYRSNSNGKVRRTLCKPCNREYHRELYAKTNR